MALEDSACGSPSDLKMHIWDAAIRDDREELKEITNELIARYEPKPGKGSSHRPLQDFLPLLDALADLKDPRHKDAIDHFRNLRWFFLRWIWIEKFKLPKEEAITFLSGYKTDPAVPALMCGLEEDVAGAEEAIDNLILKGEIQPPLSVLASYVCRKVAKTPLDTDAPDLKPPGATSTYAAVRARLEAKRR